MKFLDKVLKSIGLVRMAEHNSQINAHRDFTRLLANAAKEKGVRVMLDYQHLYGVEIDSDVFVIGSRNRIDHCDFISSRLVIGPSCEFNCFSNCKFFGDLKPFGIEA